MLPVGRWGLPSVGLVLSVGPVSDCWVCAASRLYAADLRAFYVERGVVQSDLVGCLSVVVLLQTK